MDIVSLLKYAFEHKASDLHLSTSLVPLIRVDGVLRSVEQVQELDGLLLQGMLQAILPAEQKSLFNSSNFNSLKKEIDFAFGLPELGRFRVNIFNHHGGLSAAIRLIQTQPPTFEQLGLDKIFYKLCDMAHGLILVTGPTGSGKTTTIASMIEYINHNKNGHIITLEDPIEYVFSSKQCLVHQREVGIHTESFSGALRAVLREDPDFIFVGEMRDLETIKLALTAAETGHLVFATLHTSSAAETINRIVDVFSASDKAMVRSLLASSLRAVVSQILVPRKNGGRVAAQEIMLCNAAIKNMIREDRTHQIYSVMQTNKEALMRTLEQHLQELANQGMIE